MGDGKEYGQCIAQTEDVMVIDSSDQRSPEPSSFICHVLPKGADKCGEFRACGDCGHDDCNESDKCKWDHKVCKPKGEDRCRPCEVCGEDDCYESDKCRFRYTEPYIHVCVPREGCGTDCKYCDMGQGCIRDERCKWTPEKGCSTKG